MNKQILAVAEAVSNEKSLPRKKIFEALESAIAIATKKKYDQKINIRVSINKNNGKFNTYRRWLVVKEVKQPTKEITLEAAIYDNKNIKIGDFIEYKIKSIIFNRITTQTAKQVIIQKIREAKKIMIIKKLKKKKGFLITGNIKKINKESLIIDIGYNLEAYILKKDMILKEKFKIGNKIKGIIYKIKKKDNKYLIFLNRSSKNMLIELLKKEIPEIKDKIIKIKSIVRNPGLRTKIAVTSKNQRIDPIGACIGIKGSRIQTISNELSGEKIDIILWNKNPQKFVINAMFPAEIVFIEINTKKKNMNLYIKNEYLAQAIGKNGQNIKLASQLTGWNLNLLTKKKYFKNKEEKKKIIKKFIQYLNINQKKAFLLVKNGFSSIEEIACIEEISCISNTTIKKKKLTFIKNIKNKAQILLKKNKNIYINKPKITKK